MAGLAATWFTGNNELEVPIYDAQTGCCYDGIIGRNQLNYNSGAESTIEALQTVLELNRYPESRLWMQAVGEEAHRVGIDNMEYLLSVFTVGEGRSRQRLAPVMNLTQETFEIAEDEWLERLVAETG